MELRDSIEFDSHGFPKYARPTQHDLLVVPHNKELLMDWKGHCNVEFTTLTYTCCYLYKYLFKGNKKTKVSFLQQNASAQAQEDVNETQAFIFGRVTCAMSAFWSFMGFQTYPATEPTVRLLDVKTPAQIQFLQKKGNLCDLEVYFMRPAELHPLLYAEMLSEWTYDRSRPANPPDGIVHEVADSRGTLVFMYKLRDSNKRITRIQKLPMGSGHTIALYRQCITL